MKRFFSLFLCLLMLISLLPISALAEEDAGTGMTLAMTVRMTPVRVRSMRPVWMTSVMSVQMMPAMLSIFISANMISP